MRGQIVRSALRKDEAEWEVTVLAMRWSGTVSPEHGIFDPRLKEVVWDLEEEDREEAEGWQMQSRGESRGRRGPLGAHGEDLQQPGVGWVSKGLGRAGAGLGWQPGSEEDEESDMCLKAELTLFAPSDQRQVKERLIPRDLYPSCGRLAGWVGQCRDGWQQEAGTEVGQVEAQMPSDKCKSSITPGGAGMTFRCHGLVGGN